MLDLRLFKKKLAFLLEDGELTIEEIMFLKNFKNDEQLFCALKMICNDSQEDCFTSVDSSLLEKKDLVYELCKKIRNKNIQR